MKFVVPEELFYTSNHEWLLVDENVVTIGLTDFLVDELGEILYLDLPEQGDSISIGQQCCSIESVKSIHDFMSPVNGTILEVNQDLCDDMGILNDDPFIDGWIIKIELDNEKDLATLMRANEYRKKRGLPTTSAPQPVYAPAVQHDEADESDEADDLDETDEIDESDED